MKLTRRRVLGTVAATTVLAGVAAGGGVALASTGTAHPAATATAAAPAPDWCDGVNDGIHAGRTVMEAAAQYLGLTQDQLQSKLASGQSLADVATAQGKTVSGLKNAILTAVTNQVNASTGLSTAQKTDLINELKSHIGEMVTTTRPAGQGMRWGHSPADDAGGLPGGMQGMQGRGMPGGM